MKLIKKYLKGNKLTPSQLNERLLRLSAAYGNRSDLHFDPKTNSVVYTDNSQPSVRLTPYEDDSRTGQAWYTPLDDVRLMTPDYKYKEEQPLTSYFLNIGDNMYTGIMGEPWKAALKLAARGSEYYGDSSVYNMQPDQLTLNAVTGGAMTYTDPSLLVGDAVNVVQAARGKKDWKDVRDELIQGNSGFFTDKFALEHPYLTMGINGVAGGALLGGIGNFRGFGNIKFNPVKFSAAEIKIPGVQLTRLFIYNLPRILGKDGNSTRMALALRSTIRIKGEYSPLSNYYSLSVLNNWRGLIKDLIDKYPNNKFAGIVSNDRSKVIGSMNTSLDPSNPVSSGYAFMNEVTNKPITLTLLNNPKLNYTFLNRGEKVLPKSQVGNFYKDIVNADKSVNGKITSFYTFDNAYPNTETYIKDFLSGDKPDLYNDVQIERIKLFGNNVKKTLIPLAMGSAGIGGAAYMMNK